MERVYREMDVDANDREMRRNGSGIVVGVVRERSVNVGWNARDCSMVAKSQ